MIAKRLCAAVIGMSLTGCAVKNIEPAADTHHPANPQASEAPLPPRSRTLALTDVSPPPGSDDKALMPMDHSGHGMGSMKGMQHDMPGMPGMKSPATRPGENAAPSAARPTPTQPTSQPGRSGHAGHQ